jgi:hypothetical protein
MIGQSFTNENNQQDKLPDQEFAQLKQEGGASVSAKHERLNDFTAKIAKEATNLSTSWIKRFSLSFTVTIIFASATSVLTSYLITTKYPRFIEITGARDIIVQDSNLKVFEAQMKR